MRTEQQLKKFKERYANIPILTATQIAPIDNKQARIKSEDNKYNGALIVVIDYVDIMRAK